MGKLPSVRTPIKYEELKPGNNKIRYNTRSVENEDGTFSIYLHNNLIGIMYFEGSVRIFSGGWHSRLTRQRLALLINCTNWNIYSEKGEWILHHCVSSRQNPLNVRFKEGLLIPSGVQK